MTPTLSIEQLKKDQAILANIVSTLSDGETYLPLFQRFTAEIESRQSQQSSLDLARTIANRQLN